ncbi:MAG: hypothetical protein IT532_14070 [Burkholderiales bacterium]|nr:hypothetical protein [Burkholderiales bacterium]
MRLIVDALISGTIAGIATTAAAAARHEGSPALAPVNAVSHVLWGDEAGHQDRASARYTGTGLATNHAACVFWAAVYEAVRRKAGGGMLGALAAGPAVSALAYAVDYHLMPHRLTPGYELRLSGRDLSAIFAALALSLPLRALLARQH